MIDVVRRNRAEAGTELLELVTELGLALEDGERRQLATLILSEGRDEWRSDWMSASSMRRVTDHDQRLHARLMIARPGSWGELLSYLSDPSPFLRLAAVDLIAQWIDGGRPVVDRAALVDALTRAVRHEHPKRYSIRISERGAVTTSADLDAEIHVRAEAALEKLRGR